jgi:hypothetical protein
MEELVPCYACRVAGDRASWARVLTQAIELGHLPKVDLLPVRGARIPTNRKSFDANAVWNKYAENKPWISDTPEKECVAFIVRHRDAILADVTMTSPLSLGEIDSALREVLSNHARDVAAALEDRLMVPRDMGILPAATLRSLVAAGAPKGQIST